MWNSYIRGEIPSYICTSYIYVNIKWWGYHQIRKEHMYIKKCIYICSNIRLDPLFFCIILSPLTDDVSLIFSRTLGLSLLLHCYYNKSVTIFLLLFTFVPCNLTIYQSDPKFSCSYFFLLFDSWGTVKQVSFSTIFFSLFLAVHTCVKSKLDIKVWSPSLLRWQKKLLRGRFHGVFDPEYVEVW